MAKIKHTSSYDVIDHVVTSGGYSADYEKQKYGADSIPLYAFIKLDDTFNTELIESMSNMKTDNK